jgi:putative zinc finger protein
MMSTNNLEEELRNLKFTHLTGGELAAYCDQELDPMRRARVEAHVKECFRCEKELALLLEESAALSHQQISAEDAALVERLMEQMGSAPKPSAPGPEEIAKEIPLQERLVEYLRQMVARWQIDFGQGALRGEVNRGEEVWRWQSEDGRLHARATIEKNADLTFQFSSSEMDLEGARLNFRLGKLSQEVTLRRVSESEVAAQFAVPWPYRQSNIADISIEIV